MSSSIDFKHYAELCARNAHFSILPKSSRRDVVMLINIGSEPFYVYKGIYLPHGFKVTSKCSGFEWTIRIDNRRDDRFGFNLVTNPDEIFWGKTVSGAFTIAFEHVNPGKEMPIGLNTRLAIGVYYDNIQQLIHTVFPNIHELKQIHADEPKYRPKSDTSEQEMVNITSEQETPKVVTSEQETVNKILEMEGKLDNSDPNINKIIKVVEYYKVDSENKIIASSKTVNIDFVHKDKKVKPEDLGTIQVPQPIQAPRYVPSYYVFNPFAAFRPFRPIEPVRSDINPVKSSSRSLDFS